MRLHGRGGVHRDVAAAFTKCISAVATYLDSSTRPVSTCAPLLPLGNNVPQTTVATG